MSERTATLLLDESMPGILEITLNRPEAANALNTEMGRELGALFDSLNAEPGRARAVILTGAGSRAFCAGGDLKERRGRSDAAWQVQYLVFERMARAIMLALDAALGPASVAIITGGTVLFREADAAGAGR